MGTLDVKVDKFKNIVKQMLNVEDTSKFDRLELTGMPMIALHRAAIVEMFLQQNDTQYPYYALVLRRFYQHYMINGQYPNDALPVFLAPQSSAWAQYMRD